LPAFAIAHHVYAWIDTPVLDARIVRDVGQPLLGIVADEVIADAGQLLEPAGLEPFASHQLHPDDFLLPVCRGFPPAQLTGPGHLAPVQHHHRFIVREENDRPRGARQESHLRVRLADIRFEGHRQITDGRRHVRLREGRHQNRYPTQKHQLSHHR
jgi:hypothetical protein